MKQPLGAAGVLLCAVTALALQQVIGHSGIAGGYAMTSPIPIALGIIVLSVLLRMLQSGSSQAHEALGAFWAGFNTYACCIVAALLYVAATHVGDPSIGWWLTAALIAQSLWLFSVYAALNAAGVSDRASMRIQDATVIAALSGIGTGIVWSLHTGMLLKTDIVAAIFAAAALFEYFLTRGPKAQ